MSQKFLCTGLLFCIVHAVVAPRQIFHPDVSNAVPVDAQAWQNPRAVGVTMEGNVVVPLPLTVIKLSVAHPLSSWQGMKCLKPILRAVATPKFIARQAMMFLIKNKVILIVPGEIKYPLASHRLAIEAKAPGMANLRGRFYSS